MPNFFERHISHISQRRAIIEHLAEHYQRVGLEAWKKVRCVECVDGVWRQPAECYFPNKLMEKLFGKDNYPAFKQGVYSGRGVQGLFKELGVRTEADEEAIAEQLRLRRNEPVSEKATDLRRHILEYALTDRSSALAQKLADIDWLILFEASQAAGRGGKATAGHLPGCASKHRCYW